MSDPEALLVEVIQLRAENQRLRIERGQAIFSAQQSDRLARVATAAAKTLAVGLEYEQGKR